MSTLYFTSDLHLGHESILRMQNRPFANIDEMNDRLIKNINSRVGKNDRLYILGDISMHIPAEKANSLIKKINGRKYLILGNHDVIGQKDECKYDLSLFEWIGPYLRISSHDLNIIMMHYPLMSWPRMARGAVMLHGHIHSDASYNEQNQQNGIRRFDVGVDANNYKPVSVYELKQMLAKTAEREDNDRWSAGGEWRK